MESDFKLDIQEETYHKLTNTDSANLESSLTIEEISLTLKNMKNDRSPGFSGFTVNLERYKRFCSKGYQLLL